MLFLPFRASLCANKMLDAKPIRIKENKVDWKTNKRSSFVPSKQDSSILSQSRGLGIHVKKLLYYSLVVPIYQVRILRLSLPDVDWNFRLVCKVRKRMNYMWRCDIRDIFAKLLHRYCALLIYSDGSKLRTHSNIPQLVWSFIFTKTDCLFYKNGFLLVHKAY